MDKRGFADTEAMNEYMIERWNSRVKKKDEVVILGATVNGHFIHLETDELLQKAKQKGIEEGPLQDKFDVIGEDYRTNKHITDNLEKQLFISASALKQLKRDLADQLAIVGKKPPVVSAVTGLADAEPAKFVLDSSSVIKANRQRKIRLRLWNRSFPFENDLGADYWVLPWNGESEGFQNLVAAEKCAYWLPPVLNSKQFNEIYNQLKKLQSGHFICFGWEAFRLAKLLPQLTFELDWCFNTANLSSLAYIKKSGLRAVLSKEWKYDEMPADIDALGSGIAWNPLVSYTRFAGAVRENQIVSNSHNDKFFVMPIGNGVTAMFLEEKPARLPKQSLSLQLDVAIGLKENPAQVAEQLSRIIKAFKK